MENPTKKQVFFGGRVQGVGFRYECLQIAKGYEVTGFVRNLEDGRVELLAEGSGSEVESFIGRIAEVMGHTIRQMEQIALAGPRKYSGFTILPG